MKYSCIIPVYNERSRILDVLKCVVQIKGISEIICVDDGSTDNSGDLIKKNFPQVKLLQHKKNLGKTAAVITGINSAKQDVVILLDSDLKNLQSKEIDRAFVIFRQNKLDCLLFNTAPINDIDRLLRRIFRFLLLAAGNRLIYKQYLREALRSENLESYHLEIAQNKYLMENNRNVAYFNIFAIDVSKITKEGFIKGMWDEIKMWHQIISYAGLTFFIKQSLVFAKRKVC